MRSPLAALPVRETTDCLDGRDRGRVADRINSDVNCVAVVERRHRILPRDHDIAVSGGAVAADAYPHVGVRTSLSARESLAELGNSSNLEPDHRLTRMSGETVKVNKVRVDGQMFILDPDQDVEQLQREILDAIRAGGKFVNFNTVGRATISVLITAGIAVRFEVIDTPDGQLDQWEKRPPLIEPDEMEYEQMLGWEF